jgi:hypothetical protein
MFSMVNLDMSKKQKAIRVVTALSIFSFLLFFSVFLNHNDCLETDSASSKPKIEIFDQGYPLDNQQDNLEIFRPNTIPLATETDPAEKIFFFSQPSSVSQKTGILRC